MEMATEKKNQRKKIISSILHNFVTFGKRLIGLNLRFGGTNPISGVQLVMAKACSEETGEEGEM